MRPQHPVPLSYAMVFDDVITAKEEPVEFWLPIFDEKSSLLGARVIGRRTVGRLNQGNRCDARSSRA